MSDFNDEFHRGLISPYPQYTSQARYLGYRQAELNRRGYDFSGASSGVGALMLLALVAWIAIAVPGWVWWAAAACVALGVVWYLYPLIMRSVSGGNIRLAHMIAREISIGIELRLAIRQARMAKP